MYNNTRVQRNSGITICGVCSGLVVLRVDCYPEHTYHTQSQRVWNMVSSSIVCMCVQYAKSDTPYQTYVEDGGIRIRISIRNGIVVDTLHSYPHSHSHSHTSMQSSNAVSHATQNPTYCTQVCTEYSVLILPRPHHAMSDFQNESV